MQNAADFSASFYACCCSDEVFARHIFGTFSRYPSRIHAKIKLMVRMKMPA